ncbi:YjiH family protein [Maribius pontilimi]|uniref:YjiH family protein n=1 Tax=Palleronia pontilimi TaxID=1964209 RepID=A0A934MFJ9_9RHOB|nr:YjiH family protein [Palleronia pontilimi]MBJ3764596.1 YjiH family protein [Palleronia pontilimi]
MADTSTDVNGSHGASGKTWAKFLIPSTLGATLFLLPVPGGDTWTIPFGLMIDFVNNNFGTLVKYTLLVVTVLSAILSVWYSYGPAKPEIGTLRRHLRGDAIWTILRVLGAVFTAAFIFSIGPEFMTSDATGGVVVATLMTNLLALFAFAAFGLPLLTDYGFTEFVGALLSKAFRKLFQLPGRSAVDGLASWLGGSALGVMLTTQQYDKGVYTRREAASVACTFSIVSLPFCYVIAKLVGLADVFFAYYGSVMLIGFVCALIMPRIPPLTWIPQEYHDDTSDHTDTTVKEGESLVHAGTRLALDRAREAPNFRNFLKAGIDNLVFMWFALVPATVAIAMIAMILAEYTPIFDWISAPFVPILNFAGVESAAEAAPSLVVGFADMYLPALIGESIESKETRFLIAILSVSQLIYMSEVGAILLRSNLGLNLGHLALIFVIRTIIATPIAIFLARVVVF